MPAFAKRKSFGPKIALTPKQIEKLEATLAKHKLTCFVDNHYTGSCYVRIYETDEDGCADGQLVSIRLSGHEAGIRGCEIDRDIVGPKSWCLAKLKEIVEKTIEESKQ